MELMLEKNNVDEYLAVSEIIDYDNETIEKIAASLSDNVNGKVVKALQNSNSRQELVKNLPNDF